MTPRKTLAVLAAIAVSALPQWVLAEGLDEAKAAAPAVSSVESKDEEVKALRDKATDITIEIGKLAASGKLPNNDEAMALMKTLVEELTDIKERLARIEAELESAKASKGKSTAQGDAPKTKLSGYVQFQYQDTNQAGASLNSVPFDAFRMRRVRLGLEHTIDPRTSLKVSADFATGTNQLEAQLKDAFLTWNFADNAFGGTTAVLGQQPLPLGYEIERSSSRREFPERSQYNQVMFNGERSRGVLLKHDLTDNLYVHVGGMNSLTVTDREQSSLAPGPENRLAVVGGLKWHRDGNQIGLSGLVGDRPSFTTGSGATLATSPRLRREFIFLDGQFENIGDTDAFARFEVMKGKDRVPSSTASAARMRTDMTGWHAVLGYNFNDQNQLAFRYQQFDPDTNTGGDLFRGYGLAYTYSINSNAKIVAAHEIFEDDSRAATLMQRRYHQTVLRVQFKF